MKSEMEENNPEIGSFETSDGKFVQFDESRYKDSVIGEQIEFSSEELALVDRLATEMICKPDANFALDMFEAHSAHSFVKLFNPEHFNLVKQKLFVSTEWHEIVNNLEMECLYRYITLSWKLGHLHVPEQLLNGQPANIALFLHGTLSNFKQSFEADVLSNVFSEHAADPNVICVKERRIDELLVEFSKMEATLDEIATLVSCDGVNVQIEKQMLTKASKYFEASFKEEYVESSGEISMNFDGEVLNTFKQLLAEDSIELSGDVFDIGYGMLQFFDYTGVEESIQHKFYGTLCRLAENEEWKIDHEHTFFMFMDFLKTIVSDNVYRKMIRTLVPKLNETVELKAESDVKFNRRYLELTSSKFAEDMDGTVERVQNLEIDSVEVFKKAITFQSLEEIEGVKLKVALDVLRLISFCDFDDEIKAHVEWAFCSQEFAKLEIANFNNHFCGIVTMLAKLRMTGALFNIFNNHKKIKAYFSKIVDGMTDRSREYELSISYRGISITAEANTIEQEMENAPAANNANAEGVFVINGDHAVLGQDPNPQQPDNGNDVANDANDENAGNGNIVANDANDENAGNGNIVANDANDENAGNGNNVANDGNAINDVDAEE